MHTINLLGICGSLRAASLNRAALALAAANLPDGTRMSMADIGTLPLFNGDVLAAGMPASVTALRDAIRAADGVVIASPEYNFGVPGVLKNALDWASRGSDQPFAFKPVAILSASMGMLGGARMQYELRQTLLYLEPHVLVKPEVFIGAAHTKFAVDGSCTDAPTTQIVAQQMLAMRNWVLGVRRMHAPPTGP